MTPRLQRRNHGTSHSYLLDGYRAPGVTSVIGLLDKPALVGWAAKTTAAFAVENWDTLAKLPITDRLTRLEKARFGQNRTAIIRGHRLHAMGEALAKGETVDVPAEHRDAVEAYARFLDDWQLETVATEIPCAHGEYRYAGTLDLIAESPKLGRVLLDLKTGKGVYSETALQLAAYRNADLWLEKIEVTGPRGGKRTETVERSGSLGIDRCAVAHLPVGAEQVSLVPLVTDAGVWSAFLYLLEVYESWLTRTGWDHRDGPNYSPVVGDAVWPEAVELGEWR